MTGKASDKGQVLLEDKVARLRQPATYPDHPSRIDAIETHISWVFLTDAHAYKLKKPVRYDYLDFTTLDARRRDCSEEVRLNRCLAPDVYLGIVPLTIDSTGRMSVEGEGGVIDWLVKMRRLPAERMLDFMIRHKTLQDGDIRRVARRLAAFYRQCLPVELDAAQYRQGYAEQVCANLAELTNPRYNLSESRLGMIRDTLLEFLKSGQAMLDNRVEQRRIIEGHGDLRPEHICLEPLPVIFDCLEFNYIFRIIDVIDEISFLAMECDLLGAPHIGRILFDTYGKTCGDYPPLQLINFYKAHRACLRAKLAIWHIRDLETSAWPSWRERADDYLRMAGRYARQLS